MSSSPVDSVVREPAVVADLQVNLFCTCRSVAQLVWSLIIFKSTDGTKREHLPVAHLFNSLNSKLNVFNFLITA